MTTVLDGSALLALLWSESGGEIVEASLADASMSAVNFAEVGAKLSDRGIAGGDIEVFLADLPLKIIPFDVEQARISSALRDETRQFGLSLGDRACLALAILQSARILTADRAWLNIDLPLEIASIR
jgi:PIN domain nuclease of toxin-antitoxin system